MKTPLQHLESVSCVEEVEALENKGDACRMATVVLQQSKTHNQLCFLTAVMLLTVQRSLLIIESNVQPVLT